MPNYETPMTAEERRWSAICNSIHAIIRKAIREQRTHYATPITDAIVAGLVPHVRVVKKRNKEFETRDVLAIYNELH